MIRQTGGSAVAATSTRSSPWLRANCTASRVLIDRKSTRLNSSHDQISYAVFCLKKKNSRPSSPATVPRTNPAGGDPARREPRPAPHLLHEGAVGAAPLDRARQPPGNILHRAPAP